ncbi:MAG: hypothetical protein AB1899_07905 [Pseudomonadota bacterium]
MSDAPISLPHLRTLIGLRVRHLGDICVVVEVLETPPALVLETQGPASVQADQHGRPGEYAADTRVVRILSDDRLSLNDALLDLELLD